MAMKTCKWMTAMMLCAGFSLSACTSDDGLSSPSETGQGQLMLNLVSGTKFTEDTRAVNEETYRNTSNYTVELSDTKGPLFTPCKYSELGRKMPLELPIGSYKLKAYYGEDVKASRDKFYVVGEKSVTIKASQNEKVDLTCTPTCGRIAVNFNQEMDTYYTDYNVSFTGTEALGSESIQWLKNDTEPWYVKLKEGEAGETISFTLTTTTKEAYLNPNKEAVGSKTGTFTLKRNCAYKMNVDVNYTPSTEGNLKITITIDESTNDKPVNIEVPITWI